MNKNNKKKVRTLTLRLYENRPNHNLILNWMSTILPQTDRGSLIGNSLEVSLVDYIKKTCSEEVIKDLITKNYDLDSTKKLPRNSKNKEKQPETSTPTKITPSPSPTLASVEVDEFNVFDLESSSGVVNESNKSLKSFASRAKKSFSGDSSEEY